MSIMDRNSNIFILFTTENGNGYMTEDYQKIVSIGYDQNTIQDIFDMFFILNKSSGKYNRIHDHDMMVINMEYIGKYEEVIDYQKTHIISIDVDDKNQLSNIMINIFEVMQTCKDIKQLLFTRRKKYNGAKKIFFFLIKIFINKDISVENIKQNILKPEVILNNKMKLKINDIEINKLNKNELGIKKNNWINI